MDFPCAFLAVSVNGILDCVRENVQGYSMTELPSSHDRFFKEVFSRPEVAEDFVFHFLPPHVSGLLKPGTFHLNKDSFVDANLREYFSDLLYLVDLKEGLQGYVYLLFEHKSSPDPGTAFQLLRYMTRIWEYAWKMSWDSLPPVIPVVLYNGTVEWKVARNFAALYHAPESLREVLWDFTYSV